MENLITITLDGIRIRAHHGVMPQERDVGNDFEVGVCLSIHADRAVCDDDLDGTIDYSAIADIVNKEMSVPSKLLEHVAGRIRNALLCAFPEIVSGYVKITKLRPPIPGFTGSASVSLQF